MSEAPLIALKGVSRHYPAGDDFTTVLHHIDLTIERGEMVAIIGASGSGKSTLMNILGCLDRPPKANTAFPAAPPPNWRRTSWRSCGASISASSSSATTC